MMDFKKQGIAGKVTNNICVSTDIESPKTFIKTVPDLFQKDTVDSETLKIESKFNIKTEINYSPGDMLITDASVKTETDFGTGCPDASSDEHFDPLDLCTTQMGIGHISDHSTLKDNNLADSHSKKRIRTGAEPYICEICNKLFRQKLHFNNHMLIHSGIKPYECETCKRPFRHKEALLKHKLIHSGEKPHACDVCEKQFRKKDQLVIHARIHSGEKPYQCDMCDMCFANKSNLNKHRRIHTGTKPYSCNICCKDFKQMSHLNKHKQIHNQNNLQIEQAKV